MAATCNYIRIRTITAYEAGGYTAGFTTCAEVNFILSGSAISRTGMTVTADSQETVSESAPATNVLDGNNSTLWHTQYNGGVAPQPHLLTFNLNGQKTFDTVRWRNRASGTNGCVGDYQIECSVNGTDWSSAGSGTMQTGTPVAATDFDLAVTYSPPVVPELPSYGRTDNRPGRGPYSRGQFFRPSIEAYANTVDSSLTLSISGISVTVSPGTLGLSSSVALSGSSSTLSAGSVVQSRSVPITGIASTLSPGSLTQSRTVALSGSSITFSAGTVSTGSDVTVALTGSSITISAGSLTPSRSIVLSGQAITSSLGSVVPSRSMAISGVSTTLSPGSVAPSLSISLSGQSITLSAGSVSATGDVTIALTGIAINMSIGTVVASGGETGSNEYETRTVTVYGQTGTTVYGPNSVTIH